MANLEPRVKEKGIKLGIIAVPFSSAQQVAESLVSGGVRGILNFTPALLTLPEKVEVNYIDIALEFGHLAYHVGPEETHQASGRIKEKEVTQRTGEGK